MSTATSDHGVITEAGAIRFERLLPGPIERVWDYITDPGKRARWLASGPMDLRSGGDMELVWRNGELAGTDQPVPADMARFAGEHRMKARILCVEPPRLLVHSWGEDAEVSYELEERDGKVLLTLTTRRLTNRAELVGVSGGWHAHLEMLTAELEGRGKPRFWDMIARLRSDYEARTPAE